MFSGVVKASENDMKKFEEGKINLYSLEYQMMIKKVETSNADWNEIRNLVKKL